MGRLKTQNHIGRNVLTLPVSALLAIGLWWFPQCQFSREYAVSLLIALLTAYIIVESNNTYQLIRVRSYMISSLWFFCMATMGMFHTSPPALFASFCLATSHYLLFRTYQRPQAVTDTFHTFLMLSVGCLAYAPLLLMAPFFLWYILVFMRSLSLRSFFAALVGLVTPFWFWVGWLMWKNDFSSVLEWWNGLSTMLSGCAFWKLQDIKAIGWAEDGYGGMAIADFISYAFCLIVLGLLVVWTSVYYLSNSYYDKIRTRMMFYIYIFQATLVLVFLLLSAATFCLSGGTVGREAFASLPLLLLNTTPLAAHYFTLSLTWTSLVVFFLTLILFVGLAMFSLCPACADIVINFVNTSSFIG